LISLHLRGKKEFERATMTRIGRCQIKIRHLTGNASYRRDNLAPLKISRPTGSTLTPPDLQVFLKIDSHPNGTSTPDQPNPSEGMMA
jgi:hypothetical protein